MSSSNSQNLLTGKKRTKVNSSIDLFPFYKYTQYTYNFHCYHQINNEIGHDLKGWKKKGNKYKTVALFAMHNKPNTKRNYITFLFILFNSSINVNLDPNIYCSVLMLLIPTSTDDSIPSSFPYHFSFYCKHINSEANGQNLKCNQIGLTVDFDKKMNILYCVKKGK